MSTLKYSEMLKPKNTLLKPTGKSAIKIPNQEMIPKYNGTAGVTGVNNNGIAYKNYGATENIGPIEVKGGSSAPKYSDNVGGLSYVGTPSAAPGSADVKYSDAETGSAEPSAPVQMPSVVKPMTYEEYLKSAYDKTVNNAEEARNKAVIDAQVSYQQNKATYGAKAEAMGAMGLTGSGYSDYLDAQAYNTSRNEVAVANAQAEKAKQQAEMTYSQGILQLQENKKSQFTALLEGAGNGTLSKEQIEAISGEYGLSDEQKNQLLATAEGYTAKVQKDNYSSMLGKYGSSVDSVKSAVSSGAISQEQGNEIIGTIQNNNYLEYSYGIGAGDIDQNDVEIALKSGDISKPQYEQLKSEYMAEINKIDISTYFNDKTIETAKEELSYIKNDKWIDQATKDKFQKAYNEKFNPETNKETEEIGVTATAKKTPDGKTYTSDVIDINSSEFSRELLSKQYNPQKTSGVFKDTNKENSEQYKYLSAILNDAKAGKIKQGQYIRTNYGSDIKGTGLFIYLGEGKFRGISVAGVEYTKVEIYLPEEYKIDSVGGIMKK